MKLDADGYWKFVVKMKSEPRVGENNFQYFIWTDSSFLVPNIFFYSSGPCGSDFPLFYNQGTFDAWFLSVFSQTLKRCVWELIVIMFSKLMVIRLQSPGAIFCLFHFSHAATSWLVSKSHFSLSLFLFCLFSEKA